LRKHSGKDTTAVQKRPESVAIQ